MPGTLTRWDPFAELGDLRSRFDRVFDDWLPDGGRRAWSPTIDVERADGRLLVRADLPGVKPDEIKIEVDNDVLTISGEHEDASEQKHKHYVRRERRYGSFARSIVLPTGVDPAKIAAKTKDGVTEVTIPLPESAKKAPITITPAAG